ncbi:MAG: spore germination protein [Defluviitaleaceae bacterium]|nr:spore germination protein [Defluviitaleaceae bacterium]
MEKFGKLTTDFDHNIKWFEDIFTDCMDVIKREFPVGEEPLSRVYTIYVDSMANQEFLSVHVVQNLMLRIRERDLSLTIPTKNNHEVLKDVGITTPDISESDSLDDLITFILSGDAVVLIEGRPKGIIVAARGFPNRGINQADTEVVVQGSKEAFSEVIRFNTCLIRRRIRDTSLKVKQSRVGRRSQTDVALMYIEGIVRPQILADVEGRLKNIDIDGILDSGYIEQLIEDDWKSPFPQCQMTERPDTASAAILEGRIVIIVDNSPFVLIVPTTINAFFQSVEDYSQRFEIMSFTRTLRFIGGFLAVSLPALYIVVATHHPSMLPMFLMLNFAGASQGVPLPAALELIVMDLAFEMLKEAGIRLPGAMGGAIGLVGGLIMGQAAVEAGLISPIVVIIIAATSIAGFAIPHTSLVNGFRLVKYLLIILSAAFGLFGFWLGAILIIIHLASLKSFGIPYLFPFAAGEVTGNKDYMDSLFRPPLFMMKKRPIFANPKNQTRINMPKVGNRHEVE